MSKMLGPTLLFLGGISLSCGHIVSKKQTASENAPPKVAVIVRKSEFKDQIVQRLMNEYGGRNQLVVMDMSQLDEVNEDEFDALVVMGERRGFLMLNVKERHFLRKLNHPEKLVLVMTAAVPDWKWDREDVDVISGASTDKNIPHFYEQMSDKLNGILK